MPAGEGQERERFATALEHGFGAVPGGDEELRRELELVALLQESRAALAPSPDASARMRARVMAAAAEIMTSTPSSEQGADVEDAPTLVDTPVITAETAGIESTPVEESTLDERPRNVVPIGRARGRHRFPRPMARPDRRGQLTITAAAAVMVLAVTGGGAMFSQGALPGDSLYGVKQTTESAMVGLTPGQGNKAQRQLDYAATRIDEVRELNAAPTNPTDRAADISQALQGFNEQAAAGSRMWLTSPGSANPAELRALANWAQSQSQKLSALRGSMPASAQPDADHSLRLLEDLRTRAQSLSNRQGCDKILSSEADLLGPIPARGACSTKENNVVPPKLVAPPSQSVKSNRSSASNSSAPESSDPDKDGSETSSEKPQAPGLPGLGGLTGGNSDGGVGPLPGREPASGGNLLPKPSQQPGLNLQLPLLPILFQPLQNALNPHANG